jgi:hypothetical protein
VSENTGSSGNGNLMEFILLCLRNIQKQIVCYAVKQKCLVFRNSYMFCPFTIILGPSTQYFKTRENAIHMYSPYGFTLWGPTSLHCLLQYEIVKSCCVVADRCKIIVGLDKIYNDKIKILNCMIIK